MRRTKRMQIDDLVHDLDRARVIIIDLVERCNLLGDHDAAAGFALDAVADAANFLTDLRYDGDDR